MTNPEIIFIDGLLAHYSEGYDPVKAKAYYERTKQLKGRRKGASKVSDVRSDNPAKSTVSGIKSVASANIPTVSPAQRAAKRAEASKARVEAVRTKIAKVQEHLDNLKATRNEKIAAANKSSSESSKAKKDSKTKEASSSKDKEPAKKLTASEKAEKAKKAREEYEPVKKDPSSMSVEELDKQIAKTREKITQLKSDLRKIMDNAPGRTKTKATMSTQTAGQGR